MADEIVDRGDDVIDTGDELGETGDLKDEGKEPEGKEPDAKEPAAKEPETKDKDDGITIPKARFDQAVNKARAAEKVERERADKLEAELQASKGTVDFEKLEKDIDGLEDKLEDAIKDGNVEAKQRIRREIRQKNSQMAEAKAAAYSQHATAVAVEQIRYDALVERMEAEHPELNPDLDTFDEDKVAAVMVYKSDAEAAGKSSTVALKQALQAVYGNAAPKPVAKKAEEKADEKGQEDLKKKADDTAADRKEAAVKKGLDTKGKQPSNEKAGIDSDKAGKSGKSVDIVKMSDKDFEKLEEDEIKRLRGDNV